jgi:hypothetical protein
MEEVWKVIKDYEDYQVSNLGRIKSCKLGKEKIRAFSYDSKGYVGITLCKEGKSKTHKVHRLVAYAFIPNPDNLPQVDHINRVKTDNRVENIRWVSQSDNQVNTKDRINSTGHRNISVSKSGFYVQIRRNCSSLLSKYCSTLEQAVEERDKFMATM